MNIKEEIQQPILESKICKGRSIVQIEKMVGLGGKTLSNALNSNNSTIKTLEKLANYVGKDLHLSFKKRKKTTAINKYALAAVIVMRGDVNNYITIDELAANKKECYEKGNTPLNADFFLSHAAYNVKSLISNHPSWEGDSHTDYETHNNIENALYNLKNAINDYFKVTGESKQDYIDYIEREVS